MVSITSAILYGRRKPNLVLGGQDGRVVKAGALGDTHVKLWDRTWSSSDSKKVHIGRCVGFNHVRNSYGRRKQNFKQNAAGWPSG